MCQDSPVVKHNLFVSHGLIVRSLISLHLRIDPDPPGIVFATSNVNFAAVVQREHPPVLTVLIDFHAERFDGEPHQSASPS
jgi:hypothetical protein